MMFVYVFKEKESIEESGKLKMNKRNRLLNFGRGDYKTLKREVIIKWN